MGRHYRLSVFVALIAFIIGFGALGAQPASAKGAGGPPGGFARFDFSAGTSSGVTVATGALTLSGAADGTWTSAPQSVPFAFDELVASWNAMTPGDSWITIEMQASGSGRATKWYTMASGPRVRRRHIAHRSVDRPMLTALWRSTRSSARRRRSL